MCGLVITYSELPDIGDAVAGEFGINAGDRLAHVFDEKCKQTDAKNLKAQGGGDGFKADFTVDVGDMSVKVPCFKSACDNNNTIGVPEIELGDWVADDGDAVHCDNGESYVEGIGAYHYRVCKFQCKNFK
ncbi:hypothetical protein IL306_005766 [Fusarium sp. DS 682]|nr:hypothetical protein IL306_005766 [Fusarium sp. DS 682]